jgi:hypothetical protein
MSNPPSDRDGSGRFVPGNTCARTSGLYARCGLDTGERKRVGRVRRYLREAGLPDDLAAVLATSWLNCGRVIEAFARLTDDGERIAGFDVLERATRLQLHILDRRDRAAERGEPGEIPFWQQAEIARIEREAGR